MYLNVYWMYGVEQFVPDKKAVTNALTIRQPESVNAVYGSARVSFPRAGPITVIQGGAVL